MSDENNIKKVADKSFQERGEWQYKFVKKCQDEGMTIKDAKIALGLTCEERLNAYNEGHIRGYTLGYDSGYKKGESTVCTSDKDTINKIVEGVGKMLIDNSKTCPNPTYIMFP